MEPLMAEVEHMQALPDYLNQFAGQYGISDRDLRLLRAAGATTPEAVQSIIESYPQMLENLASLDYAQSIQLAGGRAPSAAMALFRDAPDVNGEHWSVAGEGVRVPEGAIWPVDAVYSADQALADLPPTAGYVPVGANPLGESLASNTWPVKNQLNRDTCVSFAVGAMLELRLLSDVSEQFLHWALKTKTADPNQAIEATNLIYALEAAQQRGTCEMQDCAYNPNSISGNPSQHGTVHAPTAAAIAKASRRLFGAFSHQFTHLTSSGKAAMVRAALETSGAVAISLPVFEPLGTNLTNWTLRATTLFGRVFDPLPNSRVLGGHAVCVTGFATDPAEPTGGYFVIRNSWGTNWGSSLPVAGYSGPAPGYGEVSASFVDRFLYEFGHYA